MDPGLPTPTPKYHEIGLLADELAYVRCGIECGGDAHETAPSFDDKFEYSEFWAQYGYKRTGCTGCPVHCMEAYNVPGIGASVVSCELYPQLGAELRNYDILHLYKMVKTCHEQGTRQHLGGHHHPVAHAALGARASSTSRSRTASRWSGATRRPSRASFWSIVLRKGFGDVLAKGMKAAADYMDAKIPAEKRGGKSTYYHASQVNNNPMYGIVARFHGQALAYSVGRRSDLISDLDMSEFGSRLGTRLSDMERAGEGRIHRCTRRRRRSASAARPRRASRKATRARPPWCTTWA